MNEQNLKLEAVKKRCNIAAKITGIIQTLVIIGAVKILLTRLRQEKGSRIITAISVIVGITAVLLLAMGREAYGVSMLFLMIAAKGIVIYKMR